MSVQSPIFGCQSLRHQSDAAFCARWGKRMIITALYFSALNLLALATVLILLIAGIVSFRSGIFGDSSKPLNAGGMGAEVSTHAQMLAESADIAKRLEALHQSSGNSDSGSPEDFANNTLDELRGSTGAKTSGAMDQRRSTYQGLPGHYDKSGFPGHDADRQPPGR